MDTEYMDLIERCCIEALDKPHQQGFIGSIVTAVKSQNPDIIYPRNRINLHIRICLGCLKNGDTFNLHHGTVRERIDLADQRKVNKSADIDVDALLAELRRIPRIR